VAGNSVHICLGIVPPRFYSQVSLWRCVCSVERGARALLSG
jgi:hypothetical protein